MKHIKHINDYSKFSNFKEDAYSKFNNIKESDYSKFSNFKEGAYNMSSTHNIKPIYNDNVDISQLVQNTISYINDNYDSIKNVEELNSNYPTIEFSTYQNVKFRKIQILWDSKIPKLQFVINKKISPESREYQSYPITMKEYKLLKDFFIEIKIRKDIDNTKDFDAADLIDPLKVAASKYNL